MTDTQPPSKLFRNLVILIIATSLPVLAVEPLLSRLGSYFLEMAILGYGYAFAAYFAQTSMIAAFFVYGSAPIQQRIRQLLAWLAFILLLLGLFISSMNDLTTIHMLTSALFLFTQVACQSALLYVIRILFRLRVRQPIQDSEPSADQSGSQFGIKNILFSMTIMAAMLAFGRFVFSDLSAGRDFLTELAIIVWITLSAQLTATILIAAFLLNRFTIIAIVGASALTVTAGFFETLVVSKMEPSSGDPTFAIVMTINLITAFICGLFAFEIRRQGYRCVITKH